MKNFKARLAGILACLLLFIVPLQADARMERFPASCRLYQHSVRGFHLLESGMDDEKGDHHLERKHLDDRNGCIQGYACPPDQQ